MMFYLTSMCFVLYNVYNTLSIIRLMKNPVLRGHTKYGDMYIENTHEPVLSESE
jgi:site-specific DNA recombinase